MGVHDPDDSEAPSLPEFETLDSDEQDAHFRSWLGQFFAADTPAKAEAVRRQGCITCQDTPEGDQDQRCQFYRCTLRDDVLFEKERDFLQAVILAIWHEPKMADMRAVKDLNEHIAGCGCATVCIYPDKRGHFRRQIDTRTLRASLHAMAIKVLEYRAGNRVVLNLDAQNQGDAVDRVRREYDRWGEDKRQRAAELRATGLSDAKIGQFMGRTPKQLRNWLGGRSDFDAQRPDNGSAPKGGRK